MRRNWLSSALLVAALVLAGVAEWACAQGAPRDPARSSRGRPVFQDNFNGTRLSSRWSPYDAEGNDGNGLRRPSAISLDGKGHLVITAKMIDGVLVSGGVGARREQTYGRYAVRVRTEADPSGTTSAVVLTWPTQGDWPAAGENDIYETGSGASRFPFHSFVHYDASNRQYSVTHRASATRWHKMVMDWRPDAIRIYRDGKVVWTLTDPDAIPDGPHFLAVQLDAMAERTLPRPVRMYVDYVRIYR